MTDPTTTLAVLRQEGPQQEDWRSKSGAVESIACEMEFIVRELRGETITIDGSIIRRWHDRISAALSASRTAQKGQQADQRYAIWGRLGVGAKVWVELEEVERQGIAHRNIDSSGVSVGWRTFKTVMNALRHCGEKHYPALPSSPAEGEKESTTTKI